MSKPNFRQAILDRLQRLGPEFNRLWLVRECDGKPSKSQVYAYLAGKHDMASGDIETIMGVVGLSVQPAAKPKPRKRKAVLPPKMPV